MAWSTFFGVVLGAYAFYYALNLLYDFFFSPKRTAAADAGVHYAMDDWGQDMEEPYLVEEQEADDYPQDEFDDDYEDDQEHDLPLPDEGEAAPPLRVEGQGIPLEEFLKEAKSYSSSIF